MQSFIENYEGMIRLSFFVGMLAIMGLWETVAPGRQLLVSRWLRWANNLGLVVLNTVLLRIIFPFAAMGLAALAAENGWGVLNQLQVAPVLAVVISVVLLDFAIWMQHVVFHAVPVLWRLHRVHHADPDYDVTTGLRFHPIEIILSMLIKFSVILVLGPPLVAIIIFEVLLNGRRDVQSWQRPVTRGCRPCPALDNRHPGYAPGAPFGGRRRGQLELRLQSLLVGPVDGDVPRSAEKGS